MDYICTHCKTIFLAEEIKMNDNGDLFCPLCIRECGYERCIDIEKYYSGQYKNNN